MSFISCLRNNIKSIDVNISEKYDVLELVDYIEKEKIEAIYIIENFGDKINANIDFLKKIINKNNIKELYIMVQCIDYSMIYELKNLCKLTLCKHNKNDEKVNLSLIKNLRELKLNGNFIIEGLEVSQLQGLMVNKANSFKFSSKCETLERLEVISTNTFDLEQTSFLPNLNKLILTQLKLSSLNGIENLTKLENLAINFCPKLIDISNISKCLKLKKIEFDTCKKIENFESLSALKEVKGLVLGNCGSISSLNFIKDMSGLKFLSFVNTNIIDGDLTECLKLQNVGTNDKKHYNVNSKNLPKNKEYSFWKL